MKTLSIRQPWAWLIVNGTKTVENRSWSTSYRGPLAIHAALTIEEWAVKNAIAEYERLGDPLDAQELIDIRTTGAIVGVVDVVDCTKTPTDENDVEWHSPGMWAFVLRNAWTIDPIPTKGRLGLFDTDIPDPRPPLLQPGS
jgi:hypothetical protein